MRTQTANLSSTPEVLHHSIRDYLTVKDAAALAATSKTNLALAEKDNQYWQRKRKVLLDGEQLIKKSHIDLFYWLTQKNILCFFDSSPYEDDDFDTGGVAIFYPDPPENLIYRGNNGTSWINYSLNYNNPHFDNLFTHFQSRISANYFIQTELLKEVEQNPRIAHLIMEAPPLYRLLQKQYPQLVKLTPTPQLWQKAFCALACGIVGFISASLTISFAAMYWALTLPLELLLSFANIYIYTNEYAYHPRLLTLPISIPFTFLTNITRAVSYGWQMGRINPGAIWDNSFINCFKGFFCSSRSNLLAINQIHFVQYPRSLADIAQDYKSRQPSLAHSRNGLFAKHPKEHKEIEAPIVRESALNL